MTNPEISIIIATYNCSHLLQYAIKSVLLSDYQNWEMIVIGDCCTDDSAECVRSFQDDRISFTNLEENSGQQATPNNVGLSKARGRFISFLNQDDMYFPSHLSECVKFMQEKDAEIICVPYINILPTDVNDLTEDQYEGVIMGVPPDGKYSPYLFYVASSWFFSKSMIDKIGPWVVEEESYVTPSQEWLFRAWKGGVDIQFPKKVGVLVIFSTLRTNSYKQRHSYEHEYFFEKMHSGVDFMKTLFERVAIGTGAEKVRTKYHEPFRSFRRFSAYPVYRLFESFSFHPFTLDKIVRWGSKGGFIRYARKRTGLK